MLLIFALYKENNAASSMPFFLKTLKKYTRSAQNKLCPLYICICHKICVSECFSRRCLQNPQRLRECAYSALIKRVSTHPPYYTYMYIGISADCYTTSQLHNDRVLLGTFDDFPSLHSLFTPGAF